MLHYEGIVSLSRWADLSVKYDTLCSEIILKLTLNKIFKTKVKYCIISILGYLFTSFFLKVSGAVHSLL